MKIKFKDSFGRRIEVSAEKDDEGEICIFLAIYHNSYYGRSEHYRLNLEDAARLKNALERAIREAISKLN